MINRFLSFCQSQYNRPGICTTCANECPNTGNCERCLEEEHFNRSHRMNNCSNILNFYSCKYLPKYASEINYLFNYLSTVQSFNVLSLGCGPCTDFFGITNAFRSFPINPQLNYRGIELSHLWSPFHEWIHENNPHQFNIIYDDVINVLENTNEILDGFTPNFIIINYLFSSMLNDNQDLNHLIRLIANYFTTLPIGSRIIINDINLGRNAREPRFYYQILDNSFTPHNQINTVRLHFRHNIRAYFPYGTQHIENSILYRIPSGLNAYNPWLFCSSAQIVIRKIL